MGNTWKISTRLRLMLGLTIFGLLVLCIVALMELKGTMLEDRKQKTKNLVEATHSILTYHQRLASEGRLSLQDAQKLAMENIRAMRYGKNDYFFIFDTGHHYILNPPKPEAEGKYVAELKDAHGKYLVKEIISVATQQGGGYVDYWFPRPGQQNAEPKLSYVQAFTPWNWVIGTGIYIDDVDTEFNHNAMILGGISAILLAILAIYGISMGNSIVKQLGGEPAIAAEVMRKVASGDLTAESGATERGSLLHALDTMVHALRDLVSSINNGANEVVSNAERIAKASRNVASASERQADATSAMAAAIEELTVSSSQISDNATATESDSQDSMTLAGQGAERVEQATDAIKRIASTVNDASARIAALNERAQQVSSIANVIKDIAGQTNLLALNAAIEAARAGEQGRGFAVVADEVRKLAERTSVATTEIEQMISGIQSDTVSAVSAMNAALPEVEQGVELAGSASNTLRTIQEGSGRTVERVRDVANATREQSMASTSISQRVEQIAQMVEETTYTVRETNSTADQLERIAHELQDQISRFKV